MMATWKTAEESRQELLDAMGAELGELFDALSNEVTWLHWRWKQYRILFGDKPARIELLNDSAPFFFRLVQDVFFEDTLVGIARIVGPTSSVGRPNLTIQRLPGLVMDAALATEITELVTKAKDAAAFATDWRNRHIAHRDLDLALDRKAAPLAPASREVVEAALAAIRTVLNHLDNRLRRVTTAYDHSPTVGDAEQLLYVLRDGLRREQLRQEKVESTGQYDPVDWNDDLPAV